MTQTPQTAGFQVGDILSSSWGYDQTNVTFYRVIKRTAHFVTLLKLQKRPARSEDGYDVKGVVPTDKPQYRHVDCEWSKDLKPLELMREWHHHIKDEETLPCFVPVTSRHKVNQYGYVRLTSYASASPWDGKPEYDTSASGQMGH